jgi:hypothetical protein
MIDHKRKCIFIHIPKNGGRYVTDLFLETKLVEWDKKNKLWKQHASAFETKTFYVDEQVWDDYFKFAIVRNPYEKMYSGFRFLCGNKIDPTLDNFKRMLRCEGPYRFLKRKFMNRPKTRRHHIFTQKSFIVHEGELMVDHVLRFENLSEGMKALEEKYKIDIGFEEKQTISSVDRALDFYDNEAKLLVEDMYKEDFEYFKYPIV